MATARNHSCTHLLHAALRKFGPHVKQSGSLVGPSRLRFDFTHIAGLTPEELRQVEDEVNRAILADATITTEVMAYDQAVSEKQAMALFGEKYTADVRVVEMAGESVELCGGTHLKSTGQAGTFCILSEAGIAAGVRRIEALTGWDALRHWQDLREEVRTTAATLKAAPNEVAKKSQHPAGAGQDPGQGTGLAAGQNHVRKRQGSGGRSHDHRRHDASGLNGSRPRT